ncbi:MAG: NADH-quinone oxidoreductase subunit N [Thermoleophilia bacterium]|nr:NADH-quinone oxidoreductase subunit N [Thermoleophilia bacterium]
MNIAATPLIILIATAALALVPALVGPVRFRRDAPPALALLGLAAAGVMSVLLWGDRRATFYEAFRVDRLTVLLTLVFVVSGILTVLLSLREPAGVDRRPEYYCLLLCAVAGMTLVAGAADLIGMFLGIEILSVALYVLCALEVWRERSLESGLKYLIVGAVGSALLLYGLTFLFGVTGTTSLADIALRVDARDLGGESLLLGAMVLIIAGLGFKAGAAPFHMWAPDVYEGAPTPITTFMATAVKAAALAAFLRIFGAALIDVIDDWKTPIAVIAALAIVVGNVGGLMQSSFKRLLAYSSIAQAGYLLIGVATGTLDGATAVLFYIIAYTAMTVGAFAVMVIREREVEDGQSIAALAGLGRSNPIVAAVATICLLSLAGFPPLAGFIGKFMLFGAAADADLVWLAVVGAVGSVISLGYYLRPIYAMWAEDSRPEHARSLDPGAPVLFVVLMSGLGVLAMTGGAHWVTEVCRAAAESLIAP